MLKSNPYDGHVLARLLDFFAKTAPWQRRLWDLGTVLSLHEALEASDARRDGVLSEASCAYLGTRLLQTAGRDAGFTSKESKAALVKALKAPPTAEGIHYRTIRELSSELEARYLQRWADVVRDQATRPKPERTARYVAAHLLDRGFSSDYLHRWFTYRASPDSEPRDLGELFEEAHELVTAPLRTYEVLVAVWQVPSGKVRPSGWLDAHAVAVWLRTNGSDTRNLRHVGGWTIPATARDPFSAVAKAADEVARLGARVTIATRSRLSPVERAWVKGYPKAFDLRHDRRVEVRALEREEQLYTAPANGAFDNALELLGSLDDGPPGPAVAGGWAAIESLMHAPGDPDRVVAADRLASFVACSFPRAELTWLGHQHQTRGRDALAASLRAAPTNLSRAQLMAEALTREDSLSLGGPSDAAAVDRMRELLARPHEVIRDVEDHAVSTLRRLYRQRNLVMHGGLVNAVALQATLRTAAPIVGAGVDRVAHAHMVQKIHPLDLAVRARLQIDLLSSNSSTGPLTLLE